MRSAANRSAIVVQAKLRGPVLSGTNKRRCNTWRIREPIGPVLGSQVSTTSGPRLLMALSSNLACVVLPQPSMPSSTTNNPGKRRPESEAREIGGTLLDITPLSCTEFFGGCNRRRILPENHVVDQ